MIRRPLSRRIHQLKGSQTIALTAKARQLREQGVDVISLAAGEPDFPTPDHVKGAAVRALKENFTHYTANEGIPELIDAIRSKFARDNGLHFEREQILVSSGAKQSIFNALQAICNEGDEILIPGPYWVSYPELVKLAGGIPVCITTPFERRFRPDIHALRTAVTTNTRALILNTPANPTGVVYSRPEVEELAALVRETGITVISDEIYEKIIYDGRRHFSIGACTGLDELVVTVNGVSKAYAMTGWRIGFMGGPRHVVEAAARVQSQTTSNANSIAQKAAVAALEGPHTDVACMVGEYQKRRDFVFRALSDIPGVQVLSPEGALYFFIGVRAFLNKRARGRIIANSDDVAEHLLENHHLALVPGSAFGADDCLRISFACSMRELEVGIERIRLGLEELIV